MRTLNLPSVVLAAWLAGAGSLQASVYVLEPAPSFLPPLHRLQPAPFENVRQERESLQLCHDRFSSAKTPPPPPGPFRRYYLDLAERLEGQRRAGFLSTWDAVTLSGCLLRLGRPAQASALLEDALRRLGPQEPGRFLLLLNLACAYLDQNDFQLLQRAVESQQEALRLWPALWAGWDQDQWRWQRRVEQYTLKWLRQRLREQLRNGGQPPSSAELDPLFDEGEHRVRFIGPGGTYEAGGLAFEQENRLPRDAENIVIALLQAHPFDDRLYWLYGELLNARGQVGPAREVVGYLIKSGAIQSQELSSHRRVLFADEAAFALARPDNPGPLYTLFWAVAPRGHLFSGGLGDLSHEAAWLAVLTVPHQGDSFPAPPASDLSPSPGAPSSPLPGWREMLIGFAAGVVVGLLVALQWLEWRRRRGRA